MSYMKERREFLRVMREEFPDSPSLTRHMAKVLMRKATRAQQIAEILCSVDVGAEKQAELEKEDEEIERELHSLASAWGFRVLMSGDPRGYCVKVLLPSGRHNTWGGRESGFGVPSQGYTAQELDAMTRAAELRYRRP